LEISLVKKTWFRSRLSDSPTWSPSKGIEELCMVIFLAGRYGMITTDRVI
jgi:hypothetical protein